MRNYAILIPLEYGGTFISSGMLTLGEDENGAMATYNVVDWMMEHIKKSIKDTINTYFIVVHVITEQNLQYEHL